MTHPRKKHILNVYGREPRGLDDLARCVIAVINHRRPVVGFAWQISKSAKVSNSHSAPLDGVHNWSRKPELPMGYPGWQGRVWIRYAAPDRGFGSDAFHETLTDTGTGGFGSYDGPWTGISKVRWETYGYKTRGKNVYPEPQIYSWGYRFYDSDWPDLYKDDLFDIIANKPKVNTHKFLWNDPKVEQSDTEFISQQKSKK